MSNENNSQNLFNFLLVCGTTLNPIYDNNIYYALPNTWTRLPLTKPMTMTVHLP
jgi:hypothetical protein